MELAPDGTDDVDGFMFIMVLEPSYMALSFGLVGRTPSPTVRGTASAHDWRYPAGCGVKECRRSPEQIDDDLAQFFAGESARLGLPDGIASLRGCCVRNFDVMARFIRLKFLFVCSLHVVP